MNFFKYCKKIAAFFIIWLLSTIFIATNIFADFKYLSLDSIIFHLYYGEGMFFYAPTLPWLIQTSIKGLIIAIIVSIIMNCCSNQYRKWIALFLLVFVCIYSDKKLHLKEYITNSIFSADFYSLHWNKPEAKNNTPNEKTNLVMLILESIEDVPINQHIKQDINITNLQKLKERGVSFQNYQQTSGTWWSMGAVVGIWCGIPLSIPIEINFVYSNEYFLPNAICLPDILKDNGYNMYFTEGAATKFAGMDIFLLNHGFSKENIIDLGYWLNMKNKGNLVSWGRADSAVYESFKLKLQQLSKQEKPFFATMQTINTHFPFENMDEDCKVENTNFADILKCSDRQAGKFIDWFLEQDFASNTVLVVVGDHKFMDNRFGVILPTPQSERRIYNLFINSKAKPEGGTDRSFTQLDLFPSILESIGMEVKNRRAGLGVSIFAPKTHQTLLEKLGQKELDKQLLARDPIYNSFLSPKQGSK